MLLHTRAHCMLAGHACTSNVAAADRGRPDFTDSTGRRGRLLPDVESVVDHIYAAKPYANQEGA